MIHDFLKQDEPHTNSGQMQWSFIGKTYMQITITN